MTILITMKINSSLIYANMCINYNVFKSASLFLYYAIMNTMILKRGSEKNMSKTLPKQINSCPYVLGRMMLFLKARTIKVSS